MRFTLLLAQLLIVLVAISCKGKNSTAADKSENDVDAARNFIRAALDGKFDEARTFMLSDSVNTNYMDVAERSFQHIDQSIKDGYRSATINIIAVTEPVKDSETVIIYSNSFMNNPDTLKVLKANGQWLVDFKYLYQHDSDTLSIKTVSTDSLK